MLGEGGDAEISADTVDVADAAVRVALSCQLMEDEAEEGSEKDSVLDMRSREKVVVTDDSFSVSVALTESDREFSGDFERSLVSD